MKKLHAISKKKLEKSLPFLKLLSRVSDEDRVILIQHLNKDTCDVVCQCVHNTIKNPNILANDRQAISQKIGSKKDIIRYLSDASRPVHVRQKKLSQLGGNPLGLILSVAIPLLIDFLFKK